jgi:hypothetical protein
VGGYVLGIALGIKEWCDRPQLIVLAMDEGR